MNHKQIKKKWSKEKILKYIQKLQKRGADLGAGNISKKYCGLFTAASSERYYSGWGNAVKAVGIDYEKIKRAAFTRRRNKLTKWTKERIIVEIIKEKNSRNLLTAYRDNLPIYTAARRKFGSWEQALGAAGFGLKKGSFKNSNQIFRLEIQKQA